MDDLQTLSIGIPHHLDEQKTIVRIFDEQQALIDQTQAHSHKLRGLKTGLMQDLLTGQKRVTSLLKPAMTT